MDQSMMVRTHHAEILGTVIFHLCDLLNVMNLEDGKCCGLISPFVSSALGSVTTLNLALPSH